MLWKLRDFWIRTRHTIGDRGFAKCEVNLYPGAYIPADGLMSQEFVYFGES